MKSPTLEFRPRTNYRGPFFSFGICFLSACAMMVGSAVAACTTSVNADDVLDQPVGGFFGSSTYVVKVPITTVVSGAGCGSVTLTGGSVHVELWYNGALKFSGDGNIKPGVGSGTQTVSVSVPLTPIKPIPSITCQVRHSGIAYFSNNAPKATYGPKGGGTGGKAMLTLRKY